MITAFQIGAFQFDAFQEEGGGGGAYRPVVDGWGLRHWLEVRRKRALEAVAREQREREEQEQRERDILDTPVLLSAETVSLLKLQPKVLIDIDAELEEFGALMKLVAEFEELA